MPYPSSLSFSFFFNEIERREKDGGGPRQNRTDGKSGSTSGKCGVTRGGTLLNNQRLTSGHPRNPRFACAACPAPVEKSARAAPLPLGSCCCPAVSTRWGDGGKRTERRPRDDARRLLRASAHAAETRFQGRYAAGKNGRRGTAARRPRRLRRRHAWLRSSASVARSSRTDTWRPNAARRSSETGVR